MQTPTPTDELKRKSIEAIEWLTHEAMKGKITEHTLSVAADAVWMTASGLTGSVLLDPMHVIDDATEGRDDRLTVALIDDNKRLAVVTCMPGQDFITVQVSERPARLLKVDDSTRKETFDKSVRALTQVGFRRL